MRLPRPSIFRLLGALVTAAILLGTSGATQVASAQGAPGKQVVWDLSLHYYEKLSMDTAGQGTLTYEATITLPSTEITTNASGNIVLVSGASVAEGTYTMTATPTGPLGQVCTWSNFTGGPVKFQASGSVNVKTGQLNVKLFALPIALDAKMECFGHADTVSNRSADIVKAGKIASVMFPVAGVPLPKIEILAQPIFFNGTGVAQKADLIYTLTRHR